MNYVSFLSKKYVCNLVQSVRARACTLHFSTPTEAARALNSSAAAGASAVRDAKPDDGCATKARWSLFGEWA